MHEKNWLLLEGGFSMDPLRSFAEVFADLGLKPEDFHGRVIIAGHGPIAPERVFICDPKQRYSVLRPQVESVVCCDYDLGTSPLLYFNEEQSTIVLGRDSTSVDRLPKVSFVPDSMWRFLEYSNCMFDVITMCRVPNLPAQLEDDGIALIADHLNPGGLFLASGSRVWNGWDMEMIVSKAQQNMFVDVKLHAISSGGDLCNMASMGHYALVVRKPA